MPVPDPRTLASEAAGDFIRYLARRQFSGTTQRLRRHFLDEYLQHAQQASGTMQITVGELMDPARADEWLSDAAAGKIRTRNTRYGPDAAAYPNSMRVRIDTCNAFTEFLGLAGRRDSPPPARGFYLTPADTGRVLHDLTVRRPVHANAATSLRTAALAALVADTGRGVPNSPASTSAPCTWTAKRASNSPTARARSAGRPCRSSPGGSAPGRRSSPNCRAATLAICGSRPSPGGPGTAARPSSPASPARPSAPSMPPTAPSSASCWAPRSAREPSATTVPPGERAPRRPLARPGAGARK